MRKRKDFVKIRELAVQQKSVQQKRGEEKNAL